MIVEDDGGQAFPISDASGPIQSGLTMRDYFAGQALTGLSNVGNIDLYDTAYERIAHEAYRFADAMLSARNKNTSGC